MNPVFYLWGLIGVAVTGFVILIAVLVFGVGDENPTHSARAALEAHLVALDDQDWELAGQYTAASCSDTEEDSAAAYRTLNDVGYTFQEAFQIDEVWFSEDGEEVWLTLEDRLDLALTNTAVFMLRVDGEWLVAC